jgi:hypothetical protein
MALVLYHFADWTVKVMLHLPILITGRIGGGLAG